MDSNLQEAHIEHFQMLYQEICGRTLSHDEAKAYLTRLMRVARLIRRKRKQTHPKSHTSLYH